MSQSLADRINAIEECYEFMLAYAAQGLPADAGVPSGGQLREFLRRAAEALAGLPEACSAAIELVRAQPALSSQLIDNLNASIHLRALLTDLFLIDEVLKSQPAARIESS